MRHWLLLFLLACMPVTARAAAADDGGIEFFEARIRPLLSQHCYQCHSGASEKLKGGLRLDARELALKGGDDGPALVAGHPEQSRLVEAINYGNPDLQMPPKAKLSAAQIADLTEWVRRGAPWPKEAIPPARPPARPLFDLQKRRAEQWAWQPIQPQTPPEVKDAAWPARPIDRFILARLEARGLRPAPPADKRALIRRAYFDLIGLPPRPADVDAFVHDDSPDAFATVVDALLANPHFGERWARHWMDLVRYAETYGHEFDYPIDNAWRYRDYLVRAFNADVPYDEFVTEHIAGDQLAHPRTDPSTGSNESIIGSGFWFLGEQVHSPVDVRQHQADRIDNQIDVMGKTFLGLTVACARCHDHKFDPIRQKDYYGLYGILESTVRQEALLDPGGKIGSIAGQIKSVRDRTDRMLRDAYGDAALNGEAFAKYLLAAREVTDGKPRGEDGPPDRPKPRQRPIATVAIEAGLDPDRLARWVDALDDAAVRQSTHPLFAWTALSPTAAADFVESRDRRAKELDRQSEAATQTRGRTTPYKSFHDGSYDGWFVNGWSFDDGPAQQAHWDGSATVAHLSPPGIADSAALSKRFRGTLRSPSFILEKPQLLYHAAGKGGRIRLIIDGYRMDQFSTLLFSGAMMNVDTAGKFVWLRQSGDLGRYIGHRAHIELIDDGDGWLAVDEIRFADADALAPSDPPDPLSGRLLHDARIESVESLAVAYGRLWDEALQHWRNGTLDVTECELLDWAFDHRLIEIDRDAEQKLKDAAQQIDELDRALPQPVPVIAAGDSNGVDEHIFLRGSPKNLGPPVPRQFLEAIDGPTQPSMGSGCGRLELARRMIDPADPLLHRVIVNRIWHHLFGRGIVASVDNFGVMGSPPSHPELLDFLAGQFVRDGGSIKKTIRSMMLSSAYRMSSRATDAAAEQLDPDNLLLHRANLRRLEAEPIRDEILAVSGRLDLKMGGPPVEVFLTPFMEGRGRPESGPLDGAGRRSIYLSVRRNFMSPMLLAFDFPTPFSSMGRRTVSNVPAQALTMMNDPFVAEQAGLWAKHVLAEKGLSPRQRIDCMYNAAFARPPSEAEMNQTLDFIQRQGDALGLPPDRQLDDEHVWADVAHALMNVKEFIFLR